MTAYLKALTAALVAGLSVVVTSLDDDSLSSQEWVSAVIAFLVGLGAVWAVPNSGSTPPAA